MKTNQNLIRQMGVFDVTQRTSDAMFNATSLLKQWNQHSGQQKELKKYFENASTKEFIKALVEEEGLHGENPAYVKSRASRGANAGTWMTPLLFIDFAMWLNPTFKVKVLRFVYDQLITYRNDAGDAYRIMASAIQEVVEPKELATVLKSVARGMNYVVYGTHSKLIRNTQADELKAKELAELERTIAVLVEGGFLKDLNSLIDYLRRLWRKKNQPSLFSKKFDN